MEGENATIDNGTGAAETTTATILSTAMASTTPPANNLMAAVAGQSPEQQQQASAAEQGEFGWLPEKFKVTEGETGFDLTKSAQKMAQSYAELEKRIGAGDIPPADISGYKVEIEGLDWSAIKEAPGMADVLEEARGLGYTNKQMEFMVKQVLMNQPGETGAAAGGYTDQQAQAELQKEWADPHVYRQNVTSAVNAVKSLFGNDANDFMRDYGNDPRIIKAFAALGREVGEDTLGRVTAPVESPETIHELMQGEAYNNPNHADHKRVSARVRSYFEKTYGTNELV
ncbi:hypothetical protein BEE12_16060 [Pantoea agglomerans]|nr:hypothetical protein BEE12_16060 [Pantoea agglomerans]